jgi:prepilin-type N-terminal cleavage/methylation domain-containing protein
MNKGFSLVELSIVLVILGLLTGGILAGQSLIRASELRSVTTDYNRYIAAVNTFKDKYFAIPGDMANAASFWASSANGDGDAILETAAAVSVTGEMFQFWNQLALAGLIEGTYSGLAGAGAGFDAVIGTNVPKAKLSNGGWSAYNNSVSAGSTLTFAGTYDNTLTFGTKITDSITLGPILKPEEAWNIDTKIDDSMPGTGKIWGRSSIAWATTGSCTTATGLADYAGQYNLSSSTVACSFWFIKAF